MAQNLGRYTDELRSRAGTVQRGVVTVYEAGTSTLASLFTDAAGASALGNPVATDANGRLSFCVAPGLYDLSLPDGRLIEDVPVDSATADEVIASWQVTGNVSAAAIDVPVPVFADFTITGVYLAVGTAPATSAIIADIDLNGTTIYTDQDNRPTIAADGTSGGPGLAPDVTEADAGDLLTLTLDQVGTGTTGADLCVLVLGRRR